MRLSKRFGQSLIAFDQWCNCWLGSGYADETLSAYAHRTGGWRRKVINAIFFWEPDHCYDSYLAELERRHLPELYSRKQEA